MTFFLMLLQTLIALALVCGLAYAFFRWVMPRLLTLNAGRRMVRVVDRLPLDARRSLYVVEVAGQWFLVGASEAGVHLVSELDGEAAAAAARSLDEPTGASTSRSSFQERLMRLANRKGV